MSKLQWPRFLVFPTFAIVGQAIWMQNFSPYSVLACAIWIPILTYCWFCIGGLYHELIHHNLPLGRRVNRVLAGIVGTSIGIPYTVYREVHMRHHAYLNTPLDCELWPYSDPGASLNFRRAFAMFDICAGVIATPLIWSRICFSSRSPVNDKTKAKMRRE